MATDQTKTKNTAKDNQANAGNRTIKNNRYKSFRLQRSIKPDKPRIIGSFRLLITSLKVLSKNWKVFAGITIVYGVLNAVLVRGLSAGLDIAEMKESLGDIVSGAAGEFAAGLGLFIQMLGSVSNAENPTAGAYQLILVLIVSLALIWSLRQVYAGHTIRIRDGFYQGMYPFVPFLLVLGVVTLQLIPALTGVFLYTQVVAGSVAATALELILWASVALALSVVTLYMLSSSLFALYIVCLPDMTPMRALRSARDLVRHRRWTVMRKVLFVPFVFVVVSGLITIPLIMVVPVTAPWAFLVLNVSGLAWLHSYMYALYRELL